MHLLFYPLGSSALPLPFTVSLTHVRSWIAVKVESKPPPAGALDKCASFGYLFSLYYSVGLWSVSHPEGLRQPGEWLTQLFSDSGHSLWIF